MKRVRLHGGLNIQRVPQNQSYQRAENKAISKTQKISTQNEKP